MRPGGSLSATQTRAAGIAALGRRYVGFGTGFLDMDNDGWEDLVIANGHVRPPPAARQPKQRPVLLRNQGNGKFRSVSRRRAAVLPDGRTWAAAWRSATSTTTAGPTWSSATSTSPSSCSAMWRAGARPAEDAPPLAGLELHGRDHRDIAGAKVVVESGDAG